MDPRKSSSCPSPWTTVAAALVAAGLVLLVAPPGRADVVGPPPDDCPTGTEPRSSHCGSYCAPQLCGSNADCDDGETCQARRLCRAQTQCTPGWDPDAAPNIIETANASCTSADCVNATCETVDVCAEEAGAFDVDQGCGCQLPGTANPLEGWWPLLLAAAGLAVARTRSRRGR